MRGCVVEVECEFDVVRVEGGGQSVVGTPHHTSAWT